MKLAYGVKPRCSDKPGWLSSHAYSLWEHKGTHAIWVHGVAEHAWEPESGDQGLAWLFHFWIYPLTPLGLRSLKS